MVKKQQKKETDKKIKENLLSKQDEELTNKEDDILNEKNIKTKQNKQVLWAIILMIGIILIVVLVPFIKNNFVNKFDYNGIEFQKTQLGEIRFYSTRIPITNIQGQVIGDFAFNFREDPRELDYIDVDIQNNIIDFTKGKINYISIESNAPVCEDNIIAVTGLTGSLKDFGNLQVRGAISDNETYANETGFEYINCENSPNNTVILLKNTDKTSIKKIKDNCYELTYKDCEINKVSEKFSLLILEKYMSYFEKL